MKEDVKFRRKKLLELADSRTTIKKSGLDEHSPRLCAVCGRTLNRYDALHNRYIPILEHYRLSVGGFTICICKKIDNCYYNVQKGCDKNGLSQ